MAVLVDTNIMIHLRDGDDSIAEQIRTRGERLIVSVVTRVELENGVYSDPMLTMFRRAALDRIMRAVQTLDFDEASLATYRAIVEAAGYSRPRTNDRMIAATAIAHGLPLITINGGDFVDVPGLDLEVWLAPAAT